MVKSIVLFDVDGTLTKPRNKVTEEMLDFLKSLKKEVDIGIVGGSDLVKMKDQLGEDLLEYGYIDYVFSENGLVAYRGGKEFHRNCISKQWDILNDGSEIFLKRVIDFCLRYISELDIPIKRGTFVEYRTGMLNISPIGRNCSQSERDAFAEYDKEHHVLANMVESLMKEFAGCDIKCSIGGQISFDVFPRGWDKTYCLQFLSEYDKIYFFGDKTSLGGNDYEIFNSPLVTGFTVTSPTHTMELVRGLFP